MSGKHPLMRPLYSDSLKPRPAAQAVWVPAEPAPASGSAEPESSMAETVSFSDTLPAEIPEPFAPENEDIFEDILHEEDSADNACLFSVSADFLPEEEDMPTDKETDDFFQFTFSPQPISSSAPQKKKETSSDKDAIPNEQMPVPVCVPLYDDPAPERKSRWWLWLIVPLLAAGGVFAAWKCGYLPINLP